MLFGPGLAENFYNYCPTFIAEANLLHVWYCTNKESGNITDHIGYRHAQKNGEKYVFTDETLVLSDRKSVV